jgi:hypothetical protein
MFYYRQGIVFFYNFSGYLKKCKRLRTHPSEGARFELAHLLVGEGKLIFLWNLLSWIPPAGAGRE